MESIIAARVGPVDFEQAVIGPGMGVFSRYAKVLEEDDSRMNVKTALALINRVRLEVDTETGGFDPETQVALAWFRAYGYVEKPSGEAILLANAKGVALENVVRFGRLSRRAWQGTSGEARRASHRLVAQDGPQRYDLGVRAAHSPRFGAGRLDGSGCPDQGDGAESRGRALARLSALRYREREKARPWKREAMRSLPPSGQNWKLSPHPCPSMPSAGNPRQPKPRSSGSQ